MKPKKEIIHDGDCISGMRMCAVRCNRTNPKYFSGCYEVLDKSMEQNNKTKPSQDFSAIDVEIGQLVSKAWIKGLWHSESQMAESIKNFIHTALQEQQKQLAESILKEMPREGIKSPNALDEYADRWFSGYNGGLSECKEVVRKFI